MLALRILGVILFGYGGWATWRAIVLAMRGIDRTRSRRTTRPRMSWALLAGQGLPGAALPTAL